MKKPACVGDGGGVVEVNRSWRDTELVGVLCVWRSVLSRSLRARWI